ncbi:alpha/beta fold hydrolase [Actinocorallia sp. API 0066]|uniref:esterase/lipase family protein n=1 Tax=Actinocorallia sp. API 0066 TaxID=2896846 RepID=UPI001E64B727|nr:alpha/beta fold hydrolase [Actinocorallia sp. API 0066]MCD0451570.1 alpha/beta fold hydrolase [Actinocorallia sp. API 0066]
MRHRILSAVTAAVLGVGVVAAPAQATGDLPVGTLQTAVSNFLTSPGKVAGANDWDCVPSPEHPTPVVLVHATFVNLGSNWAVLSPTLANAGYCVYAFNYGMTVLSAGRVGGLGDIRASADKLRQFTDQVLQATGATQVDLVGHSQGGLMPHYYLKRLGGAPKVRAFVALAPSNHGTTLSGLTTLGRNLNLLGFANSVLTLLGAKALVQQEVDSSFQRDLFGDGDTVPGPRYTVIQTRHDRVVTPYTNAFLNGPAVRNVLLQDQCPGNPVGHIGLFADGPALQNVLNALGPDDPAFQPTCVNYGLPL